MHQGTGTSIALGPARIRLSSDDMITHPLEAAGVRTQKLDVDQHDKSLANRGAGKFHA